MANCLARIDTVNVLMIAVAVNSTSGIGDTVSEGRIGIEPGSGISVFVAYSGVRLGVAGEVGVADVVAVGVSEGAGVNVPVRPGEEVTVII